MKLRLFLLLTVSLLLTCQAQTEAGSRGLALSAPVFKWAYGGCINGPYCDTGWYASPAVADLDNDNQPEIIWGNYDLFALNGVDGVCNGRPVATAVSGRALP